MKISGAFTVFGWLPREPSVASRPRTKASLWPPLTSAIDDCAARTRVDSNLTGW